MDKTQKLDSFSTAHATQALRYPFLFLLTNSGTKLILHPIAEWYVRVPP